MRKELLDELMIISEEEKKYKAGQGLVFLYLLNHLENLSCNSSMDYKEAVIQAVLGYINSDCKDANLTKTAQDTHQSIAVLSKLIKIKTGYTFQQLLQRNGQEILSGS